MKLIIAFTDQVDHQSVDGEFVVISKYKHHGQIEGGIHYLVEDVYVDDQVFLSQEEIKYDKYFRKLSPKLQDIFNSSKTTLYFVMMAFRNWQNTLDEVLLAYNIEEIIFTDIVNQNEYLPFYEAESEVTKPLYYNTYDFISISLYNYVNKSRKGYRITILKNHSRLSLLKRVFLRRYALLILKFLIQVGQVLKNTFKKKVNAESKRYVFLSRGVAHSQYLLDYAKSNAKNVTLYLSDGLRTLGKNNAFVENGNLAPQSIVQSSNVSSLSNLLISFFDIVKTLVIYKTTVEKKLRSLDLEFGFAYSSAINEMIIHYLETEIYVRNLETYLRREIKNGTKPEVLVSCEIYTQYSYFISLLGKKLNIKTLQLISVAMNIVPLPKYFFCDKAIFNQKNVLKDFEVKNERFKDVATYWGNLTFDENDLAERQIGSDKVLKIIYFSQPVADEENDFVIIDSLIKLGESIAIEIFIKQHPRESEMKFARYGEQVVILSGTTSLKEAIKDAHLAIVKFSAVEHYLLNYGIPTIYCAFSEIAKLSMTGVIQTGYKGIAYSSDELQNLILNKDFLFSVYKSFRKEELLNRFENKGLISFNENLLKFTNE